MSSLPPWASSVRTRTAAGAALVVLLVLALAGFFLVRLQERSLVQSVDTTLALRANDISSLVAAGRLQEALAVSDDEVAAIQVLDTQGNVVAASANLRGAAPLADSLSLDDRERTVRVASMPFENEPFHLLVRRVATADGARTIVVAASLDDAEESSRKLAGLLLFTVPVLGLLAAGGTWFLVGHALSPVEGIRREVESIDETDLQRRVPEPAVADEIGRLARTMNLMLGRIESAYQRQHRFVADAAHELRSPIASLRAQLEVGGAGRSCTEGDELLAEVVRMQALVDDLLFLAAGDERNPARTNRVVDLDDVVLLEARRHRSEAGPAIDTSGVSGAAVAGDQARLARAVSNILQNAARYASSRITVTLRESAGSATVEIVDDGPGIPRADRERVFERFSRLDAGRDRGSGGAGLGLAIARAIVEEHGGSIRIEDGDAGGARFVITLPAG